MSRLAKKPIDIPKGTEVSFSDTTLSVKGPLGVLSRKIDPRLAIASSGDKAQVSLKVANNDTKPLLGTFVSHLKNMIAGVNKAFEKKLIIEGVGFKADVQGSNMTLSVGFSHPVKISIPVGLKVVSDKNGISVSGIDIEAVGQFAAKVRAAKPPEPYKGKGIRYHDEVIRRKQGKKAT